VAKIQEDERSSARKKNGTKNELASGTRRAGRKLSAPRAHVETSGPSKTAGMVGGKNQIGGNSAFRREGGPKKRAPLKRQREQKKNRGRGHTRKLKGEAIAKVFPEASSVATG